MLEDEYHRLSLCRLWKIPLKAEQVVHRASEKECRVMKPDSWPFKPENSKSPSDQPLKDEFGTFNDWWEKWGVQYLLPRNAAEQAFLNGQKMGYQQGYKDCLKDESERHLWES